MGDTAIEWTDKVWNPVTGCTKVSAGCKNCYAERIFHRPYPGRDFGDVRRHPGRLEQPLHWKKPCRIFVNSISDLFHEDLRREFIDLIWQVMLDSPQHTYQILTKRPSRMLEYLSEETIGGRAHYRQAPDWIWLGVSVEDQKTADERIPLLLQTPAAVRFVSYEPALGPIDFAKWIPSPTSDFRLPTSALDWLIAGGESGPNARPSHPDWFRSVRDQCQTAGVPFFFKQWGEWAEKRDSGVGSRKSEEKFYPGRYSFPDGRTMIRFGKRTAGRLLDGREWNEFPKTKAGE